MSKKLRNILLLLGISVFLCWSSARADISQGMVLYYPFDTEPVNGVVVDQSGNNNNGTSVGGVVTANGKIGGALSINSNVNQIDYVVTPASPSLDVGANGQFTMAAWYKVNAVSQTDGQSPIVEWGFANVISSAVHMWAHTLGGQWGGLGTGANLVDINGDENSYVISAADQPRGDWHHVAVSYNSGSGEAKVYIDGVLKDTKSFFITAQTAYDLYIGRRPWDSQRLEGLVDDVRIYNRTLSDAEVQDLVALAPIDVITRVQFANTQGGPGNITTFAKSDNLFIKLENITLDSAVGTTFKVKARLCQNNSCEYSEGDGDEACDRHVVTTLIKQTDNSYTGVVQNLETFHTGPVMVKLKAVIPGQGGQDGQKIMVHRSLITITE